MAFICWLMLMMVVSICRFSRRPRQAAARESGRAAGRGREREREDEAGERERERERVQLKLNRHNNPSSILRMQRPRLPRAGYCGTQSRRGGNLSS